ncbi:hypothetical protein BYT27DRAFT_7265762 [Phlegmacium glaucopus]|nr:hypothetical protein BYT27DRAFT_7265762 [Phlegmacium glaucopus]
MVYIGASTTAGDVIEMFEADGSSVGFVGSGGWMVFEVVQDFSMKRPIRSYELVADVQASWNKDKMLSKRDIARDEVQLCSLSNFDAYQVTRSHRAPKPFVFAVKSTDNLSFFENTADYLHSFACSEKDGKVWMEKILVSRARPLFPSYVLFQERHVLFNPKAVNGNASGLSRAGTRKGTNQRPVAAQPQFAMPPSFTGASQSIPHHDVFEPASLLSKQL